MLKELYNLLMEAFPGAIHGNREKGDALYLDADPQRIGELAVYLVKELSCALISLFAADERGIEGGSLTKSPACEPPSAENPLSGKFSIYYVFADRKQGFLLVLRIPIDEIEGAFRSISKEIPAASAYEREIQDLFGLTPLCHPDPRRMVFHGNWPLGCYPLRKDYDPGYRPEFTAFPEEFKSVKGEGVYEIPVGPVHAGIIEPGHFRFSVAGEPIINLEAKLYYVHKGIEKRMEGSTPELGCFLAERISGDESFSNSLAYCQALEKIADIIVPPRASYSRVVFAELERLTSHLGDLSGICVDVAFHFASSQFKMMRIWAYQAADLLCGMRFLRSVNKPGGIRKDFITGKECQLKERLEQIKAELLDTADIIRSNSMFMDRVENTGILSRQKAEDLNAAGPGGRASGRDIDVRRDFPYEMYKGLDFRVPVYRYGDVSCRMNVKLDECFESISLILQALERMPAGETLIPLGPLPAYESAFGMTESPRGENIHWAMTGENGLLFRYKIRTPSFCNWPALCHAVKGNVVPDFPLINKSFNLSYAGNDL